MRYITAAVFLLGVGLIPLSAAIGTQHRCGWLENPTPANWWLKDADGTWILSTQGTAQPIGIELIPDISKRDFVATNGPYGYTCACVDAEFNADDNRATQIVSVRQETLAKCQKDKKLPKP
jgi:hypothetical protein